MNVAGNMIFWIVGLIIAGLIAQYASHQFSAETRERRRCRRNHRKVVARAKRPVVMLSVKAPRA